MIVPDGLPYAVAVPRTRSSYWQDRLRMQTWCVKNIGPVEPGLWDNDAADGWHFRRSEDAVLFSMVWS